MTLIFKRRLSAVDVRQSRKTPTAYTLLAAGLVVAAPASRAQSPTTGNVVIAGAQTPPTTPQDPKAKAAADAKAKAAAAKAKATKSAQGTTGTTKQAGTAPSRGVAPTAQGTPPGAGGPPINLFQAQGRGRGAQGGFGGGPFGGGAGAGTRFSFDFRGSDILNVLRFYAQMANTDVVADPTLSGSVTIINPKQVTLDEAFAILQEVLAIRGFTALQKQNVISVVSLAAASRNTVLINPGLAENGLRTRVDPRNQVMTQVIPLENVDASTLAKELQPLINTGASLIASTGTNVLILTDTASNVERFIDLTASLDKTSNQSVLKTYVLRNAEAGAVSDIINNLYKQSSPRGQGATATPTPGQPGFNPGNPGGAQGAATAGPAAVVAVSDARTNAVLVVASPATQERIATDIINRLDDDQNNNMDVTIRKINFADATQVANTISQVLSNLHGASGSSGGNNASFQQRAFGFGGFFGGGGGGNNNSGSGQNVTSTDPLAKVVADTRTNSVIITAAPDRAKKINDLIDQLDANVPYEPTTFVFSLKNAKADDVAYALSEAFGTTSSTTTGTGLGANNQTSGLNGSQHTPIPRTLTAQQGTAGRGVINRPYSAGPPAPPNAPADPQGDGTGTAAGGIAPIPTDTGASVDPNGKPITRQGFFGGGRGGFGGLFGGQSSQQNTGPTTGRGQEGTFTNLLQLRDNVYVNAAPGGDAVIVTTTPDNYEAVRSIIASLDTVPRQVVIECIVAEVTLNKDNELGFTSSGAFASLFGKSNSATNQLNLPAPNFNGGTGSTTSYMTALTGNQFNITGANYTALLQALETDTAVTVLATPKLFTSNSQEAEVDITTKIPYIQGTTTATTGASTSQITTADIGYILNVTPFITRQGQVTLDVRSQADYLQGYSTLGSGVNESTYPIVNDRYVDTEVTAQDGQTVVLGGLIQTTDTLTINKIPLLSDIPLIGQFFRGRSKQTAKTELVIFLTPHVINSAQEATEVMLKYGKPIVHVMPQIVQDQPNLKPDLDPKQARTFDKSLKKATAPSGAPANPGTGSTTSPGTPLNPNSGGGSGTP
jgi:general secretion pathway protein D